MKMGGIEVIHSVNSVMCAILTMTNWHVISGKIIITATSVIPMVFLINSMGKLVFYTGNLKRILGYVFLLVITVLASSSCGPDMHTQISPGHTL